MTAWRAALTAVISVMAYRRAARWLDAPSQRDMAAGSRLDELAGQVTEISLACALMEDKIGLLDEDSASWEHVNNAFTGLAEQVTDELGWDIGNLERRLGLLDFWKADRHHGHADLKDRLEAVERCLGRQP